MGNTQTKKQRKDAEEKRKKDEERRKRIRRAASDLDILVADEAHQYLWAAVAACQGEVGGLFYVKQNHKDADFYIDKFVILPQSASSAEVDFDDEGFHEEFEKADREGRIEDLRGSWHSHGGMGVYYSNVDDDAIDRYQGTGIPWLLSMVVNKKREVAPRLDIFDTSAYRHIILQNLNYVHETPYSPAVKQAQDDVERLVRHSAVTTYYTGGVSTRFKGNQRYNIRSEANEREARTVNPFALCGKSIDELSDPEWIRYVDTRWLIPRNGLIMVGYEAFRGWLVENAVKPEDKRECRRLSNEQVREEVAREALLWGYKIESDGQGDHIVKCENDEEIAAAWEAAFSEGLYSEPVDTAGDLNAHAREQIREAQERAAEQHSSNGKPPGQIAAEREEAKAEEEAKPKVTPRKPSKGRGSK